MKILIDSMSYGKLFSKTEGALDYVMNGYFGLALYGRWELDRHFLKAPFPVYSTTNIIYEVMHKGF